MYKILLIEDDEPILKVYQEELHNSGFDVHAAVNGEEGLKSALSQHPDIILLDIAMPKMNGIEFMKELRKDSWGHNVPVIILTNMDPSDEILKGVTDAEPAYYLLKVKVTPGGVVEKIKSVLNM